MRRLTDVETSGFLGKDFKHGTVDCFSIIRDFYKKAFNIKLRNYARPNSWWNEGLNLYVDNVFKEGFKPLDCHPNDYKYGDVIFMAIRSKVPCHAAVYLGQGKILHHFYGRKSNVELYKGLWQNATTGVYRHKDVDFKEDYELTEVLDDPRIATQILLRKQRTGTRGSNSPDG
jgi:cell wall-associated NlpC family hydrolase